MIFRISKYTCFVLLWLSASGTAQNSSLHIENITFPEGLQVRGIEQIFQDTTGLIWMFSMGNRKQVLTYDGISIKEIDRSTYFPDELINKTGNLILF